MGNGIYCYPVMIQITLRLNLLGFLGTMGLWVTNADSYR